LLAVPDLDQEHVRDTSGPRERPEGTWCRADGGSSCL
jgi:hypothetical protein